MFPGYSRGQANSTKTKTPRSRVSISLNYPFYHGNVSIRTYWVDLHEPICPNQWSGKIFCQKSDQPWKKIGKIMKNSAIDSFPWAESESESIEFFPRVVLPRKFPQGCGKFPGFGNKDHDAHQNHYLRIGKVLTYHSNFLDYIPVCSGPICQCGC